MNAIYLPHYEWAIVLALCFSLWCATWVWPRFGLPAASLLGFLGINTIWVWVWVENRYYPLNPYDQQALRYFSVDSMARMLILVVPLMALSKNHQRMRFIGKVAAWLFVVLNSILVVMNLFINGCEMTNICGGIGNPSIMVGATVCMLPVALNSWRRQWWLFALVALAVVACKSSIALGLLMIYLAITLLRKKAILLALLLSPIPLAVGYFMLGGQELFNSSDRFLVWSYMMPKWATIHNMITGTGWGTYHVFSINLQAAQHLRDGSWWDTFHNDWLQMVFECGLVGAALMVATYFYALWQMVKRQEFSIALSIVLYGVYMGANPALHHAVPALFGAWLFVYALRRDDFTETNESPIIYQGDTL